MLYSIRNICLGYMYLSQFIVPVIIFDIFKSDMVLVGVPC